MSASVQKQSSKPQILQRINRLKELKDQALRENSKELQREAQRIKETQKAKAALSQVKAQEEAQQEELRRQNIDVDRIKRREYTIEQDEAWNEKLKSNKTAAEDREFQNFKQLARRTYSKELKNLDTINTKQYEAQKQLYHDLKQQGKSEADIISSLTDRAKLNAMVIQLKERETNTVKRRKLTEDNQNSINEKNKQFNDKLNRHYDEYLSDLKDNIKRGSST
ncbi:hypothetical protein OGAPHI_003488 [Ogataea philodendri]|uniref:Pre-mRNA-splicing factor SYF2 n=2 Tax=Saccharomycotina TaxID=147537 RepID=A0A9P8P7Y4_9ASCO|nr:uncharacterized protein OGAPHI_003488 [Ogataea philodendri]KAH3666492.1 hypothetical protein OGAPHI_003488 [Ogataea philodendri]